MKDGTGFGPPGPFPAFRRRNNQRFILQIWRRCCARGRGMLFSAFRARSKSHVAPNGASVALALESVMGRCRFRVALMRPAIGEPWDDGDNAGVLVVGEMVALGDGAEALLVLPWR